MPERDDPTERLLRDNLGVRPGERLLVVTDTGPFERPTAAFPDRPALGGAFVAAATALGGTAALVTYDPPLRSGVEPPASVFAAAYPDGFISWAESQGLLAALLNKTITPATLERVAAWVTAAPPRCDALLVLSRYSVSHTRFRTLLTSGGHTRAATMPGVEPWMFDGVMRADWSAVARRSHAVARLLSQASAARIVSGTGDLLTFGLAGRAGQADTGILNEPGAFGNLPGGEAFIAPLEGSADGSVCVGPREEPQRARFRFAAGRMVEVSGALKNRERLDDALRQHHDAANLAELGVGTNECARDPDNILEAEKILGTLHLALGDNANFGGAVSVPFHQDYVVYAPTLLLVMPDGSEVTVLDRGRLAIG